MSTARLTFLYPPLLRSLRLGGEHSVAAVQKSSVPHQKSQVQCRPRSAPFSTSSAARQAIFERHGKAVEPISEEKEKEKIPEKIEEQPSPAPPAPAPSKSSDQTGSVQKMGDAQEKELPQQQGPSEKRSTRKDKANDKKAAKADTTPESDHQEPAIAAAAAGTWPEPVTGPHQTPESAAHDARIKESGPMEAIMHMPPPGSSAHPHISTPPYVHHFDSYTLVKELQGGGYSQDQAITVMKAVRARLKQHLDVAQKGLVSKSDVDNETYLFEAACSELSSEVRNNRRTAEEEMRQQRTHLTHEFDILNQRMSQDLLNVKDEVRGMFNERKLGVREEQRAMESAIHRINLKISVLLSGDAKSDIEGLRWVLIRRSVLGIAFMVVLTLATLRYATHVKSKRRREAEAKAKREEDRRQNGGKEDHAGSVDAAQILAAN